MWSASDGEVHDEDMDEEEGEEDEEELYISRKKMELIPSQVTSVSIDFCTKQYHIPNINFKTTCEERKSN